MTIQEAIDRADSVKPNAFSTADKVAWINSLEGTVALEVFLMAPAEAAQFHYTEEDVSTTLLIDPPFDDLYVFWLEAMIDEANGEYDRYQNDRQMFNSRLNEFTCFFCSRYDPAQGYKGEELLYG